MIAIERTARMLAAELSDKGQGDWQRYLFFAREVNRRLDDDFGVYSCRASRLPRDSVDAGYFPDAVFAEAIRLRTRNQ